MFNPDTPRFRYALDHRELISEVYRRHGHAGAVVIIGPWNDARVQLDALANNAHRLEDFGHELATMLDGPEGKGMAYVCVRTVDGVLQQFAPEAHARILAAPTPGWCRCVSYDSEGVDFFHVELTAEPIGEA